MEGKKAVLMEQQPSSPAPTEDSQSESMSLSDSSVYSETESVGSVNMTGCSRPKPSLELGSPRRRKKKEGAKFLMFSKEIPDVPMQKIWAYIRDHKMMAALIPGIIEGLDFIEGEGGTGSVYVANFNPKAVKPGEDRFVINKVEVSDDESKLYAVRCVGGRYRKFFNLFIIYVNVLPHEVGGDSSTVLVWRFEYDLVNPNGALPEDSKLNYMAVVDMMRESHHAVNRVERPLAVSWLAGMGNVTKRLRVAGGQKRLTGAEEREEPEDRFQQETEERSERHRRKRKEKGKGKPQDAPVNGDEGSDRESRITETRGGIQALFDRQEDEGEGSPFRSFLFNNIE